MNPESNPLHPRQAPHGSVPPKMSIPGPPPRPRKGRGFLWLLALGGVVLIILSRLGEQQDQTQFTPPPPPPRPFPQRPRGELGPRIPMEPQGRGPTLTPQTAAKPKIAGPQAAAPEFSPAGGIFAEDITVELKPKSTAATVRYTLDGSDPTEASKLYEGPIAIDSTTLLRAKCFEPGMAPSATASRTYTLMDSTLAGFESNLPLVIINTFGQGVSKDRAIAGWFRVVDPGDKRSAPTGPVAYDGLCDIKLRGFSSLRLPKRSFSVRLRDDAGEAAPAAVLGLPADSDWVLYAPYSDKTLMRDVLAYDLSNRMGRYAARTRFVEVFVNRHGGKLGKRDYVGVYVFEEKIKRGKDRVNVARLTPQDKAEPEITGGYIVKRDHTQRPMEGPFGFFDPNQGMSGRSDDEGGFSTSHGLHLFYVEPKESELTAAQKTWLTRYFTQFEKALYGGNFASPTEGYAKYLDVDSFIDQFWIVELSKNVDGFRYSCYMTKDRGGKLKMEPIWDWNLSFGNANYHEGWMTEQWYWRLLRDTEVCWFRRLGQDPEFMQRLTDRWSALRQTVIIPEKILARIDEYAALLNEAQQRNFQRWPILGQSVHPNFYVGETYQDEVDWMKNWIQERIAWIDSQFMRLPKVIRQGNDRGVAAGVGFEPAQGQNVLTLDGSDPLGAGAAVASQASEDVEPFAVKSGAHLLSRARAGENWGRPLSITP